MHVHRSKKCTTPHSHDSTEGDTASGLPSQQEFQQDVRKLSRGDGKGRGKVQSNMSRQPVLRAA
jgi:hypothetical protein